MPRRSKPGDIDERLQELRDLIRNFEQELARDDLRMRVLALVPVHRTLADLSSSLIPKELAETGQERILHYFRKYPHTIISGEEVMVVAGIDDWARRLRELRVERGWSILSGETAKAMAETNDLPSSLGDQDLTRMKVNDYVLTSVDQDLEAAYRWSVANSIRKERLAVKAKILKFLQKNVGKPVTGEELRYVAGSNKTEWARRTRELRTQDGWPLVTKQSGRPDLSVGVYVLEADRQNPPHDREIPDKVRLAVLERDEYSCQVCGWSRSRWSPQVPLFLELHHVKPHVEGGANDQDNLVTLCSSCHDDVHRK
jgi:hypothetical protein